MRKGVSAWYLVDSGHAFDRWKRRALLVRIAGNKDGRMIWNLEVWEEQGDGVLRRGCAVGLDLCFNGQSM